MKQKKYGLRPMKKKTQAQKLREQLKKLKKQLEDSKSDKGKAARRRLIKGKEKQIKELKLRKTTRKSAKALDSRIKKCQKTIDNCRTALDIQQQIHELEVERAKQTRKAYNLMKEKATPYNKNAFLYEMVVLKQMTKAQEKLESRMASKQSAIKLCLRDAEKGRCYDLFPSDSLKEKFKREYRADRFKVMT